MTTQKSGLAHDAREFARLHAKKRKLKRQLDTLGEELAVLEERLSEQFLAEGVSSIKTRFGNPHLRTEVWPALVVPEGWTVGEARQRAVEVLQEMGRNDLVTFNHQSLRTLVREMMDEDGTLPEPLGSFVRAEIKHRIGVRGANDGKQGED